MNQKSVEDGIYREEKTCIFVFRSNSNIGMEKKSSCWIQLD